MQHREAGIRLVLADKEELISEIKSSGCLGASDVARITLPPSSPMPNVLVASSRPVPQSWKQLWAESAGRAHL